MNQFEQQKKNPTVKVRRGPLWTGPSGEGPNGGVTQSLIGRFLSGRERFRLHAIEGYRVGGGWNHRMGYGTMWHVCEELYTTGKSLPSVFKELGYHCQEQIKQHPLDREKVDHWGQVCKVQFPLYVQHWAKHPDQTSRTSLLREQAFDVSYDLPSGRTVRLRGKWDGVDLVAPGKCNCGADRTGPSAEAHSEGCPANLPHVVTANGPQPGIWLAEHKTKGDVDVRAIERQLRFDLQTMLYLVALHETGAKPLEDSWIWNLKDNVGNVGIIGVNYNVVRRPLSGGKGTIKQCKNETVEQFYARLGQYIRDDPGHYFQRFRCEVTPQDVAKFRRQCLDPILEQMCDWYDWVIGKDIWDQGVGALHWRHPYGCYNPLNDGGFSDVDAWLDDGGLAGLKRTDVLFPELEG